MYSPKRIIYFKLWWNNIGNAFIDFGAQYILKRAHPNAEIYSLGGCSIINLLKYNTNWKIKLAKKILPKNILHAVREKYPNLKYFLLGSVSNLRNEQSFDLIGNLVDADYIIFSGMVLNEWFIQITRYIFEKLKNKNTKIIILGGGGAHYTEHECEFVRKFLNEIKPYALISRDEWTYRNYYDLAEHAYNGIDCGFFVSDFYPQAKLNSNIQKYVILNFDKLKNEPNIINTKVQVIRVHHSYYLDEDVKFLRMKNMSNVFVSDNPYDYLILYANAIEVHSDRVHACVASLSYGTPFKLYYKTPRGKLFERVGINPYNKIIHSADYLPKLEKEKKRQIQFLSEIF